MEGAKPTHILMALISVIESEAKQNHAQPSLVLTGAGRQAAVDFGIKVIYFQLSSSVPLSLLIISR